MAFVYKPHGLYDGDFDEERCKASVADEGRGCGFHQCSRKPKKDGWCGLHHPDAEKKRDEANEKRAEERDAASPYGRYKKAAGQRDKLKEALKYYLALHNDERGGVHRTEKQKEACRQMAIKALEETR